MSRKEIVGISAVIAVGVLAAVWLGLTEKKAVSGYHDAHHGHSHGSGAHSHDHSDDRGPHGGKVLREGEFELEFVIYEKGATPHIRMYPSYNHKPLDPAEVAVSVELERLGGRVDTFRFKPGNGFLYSEQELEEPHSFIVKVAAEWKGEKFDWEYSQYEDRLTVPADLAAKMGLATETAGPGRVVSVLSLPGEIAFNADMVSHVVPRVPGVVLEARKNLGDIVQKGETIAVIDSRELGEARSKYLIAIEREKLARYNFERSQRLWEADTVAEKEFLTAQKSFLEEKIELTSAERKLKSLGLSEAEITGLAKGNDNDLTHYVIRAPFDGVVIKKHLSHGEWVKEDAEIYVIADLSSVWVDIIVYAKDIGGVRVGQDAKVTVDSNGVEGVGKVSYVGPLVGEDSRTAKARVVLPNPDGRWLPGLFAKVELVMHNSSPAVVVRNEAIQTCRNKPVIFVRYDDRYEARPVLLGRSDGKHTEILKGLSAGEHYVMKNSYVLKAELGKAGMSHEH
ncbi:MAG: efflux RND transporter periplasmic adaptor subunit [Desulfomonile sp.]|nr:efflux RND transporter periplasmic adaptor subunit [Desulfomonile sp.]